MMSCSSTVASEVRDMATEESGLQGITRKHSMVTVRPNAGLRSGGPQRAVQESEPHSIGDRWSSLMSSLPAET